METLFGVISLEAKRGYFLGYREVTLGQYDLIQVGLVETYCRRVVEKLVVFLGLVHFIGQCRKPSVFIFSPVKFECCLVEKALFTLASRFFRTLFSIAGKVTVGFIHFQIEVLINRPVTLQIDTLLLGLHDAIVS